MTYKEYQDELYHYGILGMKWGVRRYQNADGTYTELGKKKISEKKNVHALVSEDYVNTGSSLKSISSGLNSGSNITRKVEQTKRQKNMKRIDVSKMTDQELQREVNRMNLERNYKNLKYEDSNAGRMYVSDVLSIAGDVAAIGASIAIIASIAHKLRG